MDELGEHYAKWEKSDMKGHMLYDFCETSRTGKSIQTEWLPGAEGMGSDC